MHQEVRQAASQTAIQQRIIQTAFNNNCAGWLTGGRNEKGVAVLVSKYNKNIFVHMVCGGENVKNEVAYKLVRLLCNC